MAQPAKGSLHTSQLHDVFVIGAGASVPYGFPTGAQLLQELREESIQFDNSEHQNLIASLDFPDALLRFAEPASGLRHWNASEHGKLSQKWSLLVRGSVILTIDQFLKNLEDPRLKGLGKRLMARRLLAAERESCRKPRKGRPDENRLSMHSIDWIQQFLTRVDLLGNWEEYLRKTVFLTFNYDRVLEFFLERYLVVDKNWSRDRARAFVHEDMAVLHLNGHIGSLGEVPFGNLLGKPEEPEFDPLFDSPASPDQDLDWTAIARRMRTVWETPADHPEAEKIQDRARSATAHAKRIFILGTSFIPENLDSIGLNATGSKTALDWDQVMLFCTTSNLSEAQSDRAAKLLGVRPMSKGAHFFDKLAYDFVVDHVVL